MGVSVGNLEDRHGNSCDVGEGYLYGGGTLGFEGLELVEAGAEDRASVLDSFDTVVIRSRCFRSLTLSPTILIRRHGGVAEVIVQSWGLETNERKALEGGEVSALISAVLATHADTWMEPFESDCCVLDGCSWEMNVCSGPKRFSCSGVNSAPAELVGLFTASLSSAYLLPGMAARFCFPAGENLAKRREHFGSLWRLRGAARRRSSPDLPTVMCLCVPDNPVALDPL